MVRLEHLQILDLKANMLFVLTRAKTMVPRLQLKKPGNTFKILGINNLCLQDRQLTE